jgi:hypothetical protein
MVLFSNEPLRVVGPHTVVYDALAKDLLDVRWTFGLFSRPRAENTRVTFVATFASGKVVEWSPVDLNTRWLEKGHEAIMRNWLDENIGDHGVKTDKRLMRDATMYAANVLSQPNDAVKSIELYKTVESIPAPNSKDTPEIVERTMLFTLHPETTEMQQ